MPTHILCEQNYRFHPQANECKISILKKKVVQIFNEI